MHRALGIDEIFAAIVQAIGNDKRRSTMAALASTCRALFDPASDVLWENMHSLEPLLKCLPGKFMEQPLRLSEACELLPKPWARFLAHAARVKTLDMSHNRRTLLMTQKYMHLLALVRSLSGVPLFPCLHTLTTGDIFTTPRSRLASYMPLFLGPEMRTIQLALEGDEKNPPPALDQILLHCPRLSALELESMPRDHLMGALSCLFALEKLTCTEKYSGFTTPRDLSPIAHLPCLRHLVVRPFRLKVAAKKIPKGLQRTPMFPTLEILDLFNVRYNYSLVIPILQSITSTQLHTLLMMDVAWETDVDSLDDVLRLVARFSTLRVLHLHGNAYGFTKEFPCQPLLQLQHLEELDLRLGNVIYCTERGVLELGRACPKLRRLTIFPDHRVEYASLWSPGVLELFVAHCPKLEFLSATLSPSAIPLLDNRVSPACTPTAVTLMLSIGNFDTELEETCIHQLAAYIFKVYPNAACTLPERYQDDTDEKLDPSHRSWRRVSQALERMRGCKYNGNPGPE